MIELTVHGYERIKERNNIKGHQAHDYANRAYLKGKNIQDFSKETQRYLSNVLFASSGDCLKVWSNQIFLFGHKKLITVFPMPNKLQKKENRNKRR